MNYAFSKNIRYFLIRNITGFVIGVFVFGCAQIVPLTGGIKDTTPPTPLKSIPENRAINVTSRTIVIEFNEFLQLNDVQNQLIITPQLKEFPDVSVKGKNLVIKFNEILLVNSTYCLNFGNSITDLHEGNQLKNYTFVFSTGNSIDTLKLSGKLIDAFTLEPIKDAWVMLYDSKSDSIVYRDKPMYIGKSGSDGNYV
ncbi:MAG TPA: Ig-like domain-containing protein, partial [Nitrosopumilaceae archaeon]|nr:Ig-like domain-containing protein [Nitrosopumilaceae archaeon]